MNQVNGQHNTLRFQYSSPRNPCPVCGRTKDRDCRLTGDGRVFCHSYQQYKVGDTLRGSDGQEWACISNTTDGAGWGLFKVHQPLEKPVNWAKPKRPQQVTYYEYPDREGKPLVRVKRTDDGDGTKNFCQERWGGQKWQSGLGDLDRKLIPVYRYQDVQQAIARGELIYWVEGEATADLLWGVGIAATTSIGGSGGFSKYGDYSQDLAGAKVVICPDRDRKGLAYASQVSGIFNGQVTGWVYAGDSQHWQNPTDGYDLGDLVSDLRNQGLDNAAIKDLVIGAIEPRRESVMSSPPADDGEKDKPERKSVALLLIELARSEAQLWLSDSGDTWADIVVDGVFQWHPIRSRAFKAWLGRRLLEIHGKAPNSEAMQSCLNILEAYSYGTPKRMVYLRTAQHEGHIYIDLTNDGWQVVAVTPDGWQVMDSRSCPVRFARHDGQLPLPVPVAGGNISQLWELIPVNRESDRILLLAWLTFCLTPVGAKPILTLHGAKGAGKSWIAETISQLVDPIKAPLLKAVGDNRQMAVTASKRWVLAFDNLTSLTTPEQDILCCTATGAGFSHRKLHTDMDEVFYEYTRPQILTAVDCIPTRSDLLDRCLLIGVDRIPEEQRVPLEELITLRETYRPALLGALLDRAAVGLKYKDTIKAPLPRMADFARFALATEKGDQSGSLENQHQSGSLDFATAYRENIAGAVDKAIENNPVAAAILELMNTCTRWEGSAGDLLAKLQTLSDDPRVKKLTSRTLGRWLGSTANQTDLRAVGIEMDSYRKAGGKERGWLLHQASEQRPDKQGKMMSLMSLMSQPNDGGGSSCDMKLTLDVTTKDVHVTGADGCDMKPDECDMKPDLMSQPEARADGACDISDISDMKKPCLSAPTSDDQEKEQSATHSKDPDQTQIFQPGQMVRYIGSDPQLREALPDPAPIVDVFPVNETLWVMRPCKIPTVVPMRDLELVA